MLNSVFVFNPASCIGYIIWLLVVVMIDVNGKLTDFVSCIAERVSLKVPYLTDEESPPG